MNLKRLTIVILALILMGGCENAEESPQLQRLNQDLEKTINDARNLFEQYTPSQKKITESASNEVEKLFIFEYEVFKVSKKLSPVEIEHRLGRMGEQRWECFHVEPDEKEYTFFCKRRPKSYLRYILRAM